jgi:hypothetical protein
MSWRLTLELETEMGLSEDYIAGLLRRVHDTVRHYDHNSGEMVGPYEFELRAVLTGQVFE